jgi:hypothetical protein
MIDQVEQLTATSLDVKDVINQLPIADADRDFLLDSLNETNPNTNRYQGMRIGIIYASIIAMATVLAVVLISMMGHR